MRATRQGARSHSKWAMHPVNKSTHPIGKRGKPFLPLSPCKEPEDSTVFSNCWFFPVGILHLTIVPIFLTNPTAVIKWHAHTHWGFVKLSVSSMQIKSKIKHCDTMIKKKKNSQNLNSDYITASGNVKWHSLKMADTFPKKLNIHLSCDQPLDF